jgi:multiple sugar transport system ATP-binding protein
MGAIQLRGVTKEFGHGVLAANDVTLDIHDGEFMVLVGPSGCGKSTLLRMVAGLEDCSGGSIHIGGADVTRVAPRDRDVAMVFQNYALYPHMSVRDNLAFGLKLRGTPKQERIRRVKAVAETLGLSDFLNRRPAALSGGQRQRVAMGRAMVREPKAFLMDEPLSNLDAKLRVSMRAELARMHERLGVTTIYVTHDQVEAMTLGDRVAVMRDGVIQQVDRPQMLFRHPANLFVAAFIGSPAMNLVHARIDEDVVQFADWSIPLAPTSTLRGAHRDVVLGIRPTDIRLDQEADSSQPRVDVTVEVAEELGPQTNVIFRVDAPRVSVDAVRAAGEGDEGTLFLDDSAAFTACVDGSFQVVEGTQISLAVNCANLHFFDPVSGEALTD